MTMRTGLWLAVSGLALMQAGFGQDAQKCAGMTAVTPTLVPGSTTVVRSAQLNPAKTAQGNSAAVPG